MLNDDRGEVKESLLIMPASRPHTNVISGVAGAAENDDT
jgi:hypothetical protein